MKYATEKWYECLQEKRSLIFETVFSSQEKLEYVERALDAGFFVRLFFIGTDSPDINAARITRQVMVGGHAVPIEKIISRYQKSINNLAEALQINDRGYVYDNSVEKAENPNLQIRTVSGKLQKIYNVDHFWASELRKVISRNVHDWDST